MKILFKFVLAFIVPIFLMATPALPQEFGDFDPFKIEEASPSNSVKFVADPTGTAPTVKVHSFHIPPGYCSDKKYGDGVSSDCKFQSTRSQMWENVAATKKNGQVQPKSAWYGFSIFFPSDSTFGKKQTKGHQEFAYWHNEHCPHLSLKNFAGSDDILAISTTIALGGYDCSDGPSLKIAEFKDLVGKWNRFEVFVNWSNNDSGEMKLFLDGKYVINYRGPTLTAGFENKNYFKFGSYLCCTADVKKVKEHRILYAAVKRAPTRDGLFVEEDHKLLSSLQTALNALGCDVGAVDGKANKKTRDAVLSCKAFPAGQLPAELSAGSLRAYRDSYTAPSVASLPKGTQPNSTNAVALVNFPSLETNTAQTFVTATYQVRGGEAQAKNTGDDSQVDSDFTFQIKKNKDVPQLGFILVGSYSQKLKNFVELRFILQDGVKGKSGLDECPASVERFPDGTAHANLTFSKQGDNWVATNAKCLMAKLPKRQSKSIEFLATNFADLAVGMMKSGSASQIRHNGVKVFIERVALGEIKIQAPAQ